MHNPDITLTFQYVSDELFKILSGCTQKELDTFRRNNAQ